jgi:hypothetical protein
MANYLKYSDIPIYANFYNEGSDPVATNASANHTFATTEASLTLDPILTANRYLGAIQNTSDFALTGPLEGKFSMTFFPLLEVYDGKKLNVSKNNQLAFFDLTGNFMYGHNIKISNYLLKKCYLQNYSIKINAYQPISVTANFISYDVTAIQNTRLSGFKEAYLVNPKPIAIKTTEPHYETLHALTTSVADFSQNTPITKINIDINVECNRTPIYTIGSQIPTNVVLNTVERTTNIQGENIGYAIGINGGYASAIIKFLPLSQRNLASESDLPYNNLSVLSFTIDGRVTSQQLSASQGSILNGKVVIKEIIL